MTKIGVFGSAVDETNDTHQKAFELGRQIALNNASIITGACQGLPFYAVRGAKANSGYSIGFSAVCKLEDHKEKMSTPSEMYDELRLIPLSYEFKNDIDVCYKYRNVNSVAESDIAIFISGRWGTLNEFSNAFDMGKIIGVLEGTGGISTHIKILMEAFKKKSKSKVFFDSNPETLVNKVLEALNGS